MTGPQWNDDDDRDLKRMGANSTELLQRLASAPRSGAPSSDTVCEWHQRIYANCHVPVLDYVGHYRGDPGVPELIGYEVGVGRLLPDGYPEKVGVPSRDITSQLSAFFRGMDAGLTQLDTLISVGDRPRSVDELAEVVGLVAQGHGEWVRLHPFANGNGRTARVWAAFVALRYGLPPFVTVKPRPHDIAYLRAAKDSMGRPTDFIGDHATARAVFGEMLSLTLLSTAARAP